MNRYIQAPRVLLGVLLGLAGTQAYAEEGAIDWGFTYKGDLIGVLDGGSSQAGRYLDNIDLTAEVALGRTAGWGEARLYAHILNNSGGAPNELAGTLQGVDNIEVERPRAKLYQFWIEQEFADERGSVLAGLYDLNSEFYVTEAAGELIAPAFGIGSELASTGPNGPSIFPSTALALRVRWALTPDQQIQAAIINADAGVLGDPGGVEDDFDNGALLIAEWSRAGDLALRAGIWRYSDDQDDIREVDGLGNPVQHVAHGVYASVESPLAADGDREFTGFLRIGLADGDTTDFHGGWQAGVRVAHVFASRPDSVFAVGINQGVVSSKFRANQRDIGVDPATAESALELTYSDRISEHFTLQPDLQIIHHPGADRERDNVVVAGLRVIAEF